MKQFIVHATQARLGTIGEIVDVDVVVDVVVDVIVRVSVSRNTLTHTA